MHRIDGAGHVDNRFVAEDAAANRPPTEVTPEIMNAFQEELATFIEWAGFALAKSDNNQLRKALLAKFAPLESPEFSGNPKGPTAEQDSNDTSLANTAFVCAVTRLLIQKSTPIVARAEGTADAITGSYTPVITALTDGLELSYYATSQNSTTTPTFTPNSGVIGAKTQVKGNGLALAIGDILPGWNKVKYSETLGKWVLLNPATGVNVQVPPPVPPGVVAMFAGTTPPTGWLVRNGSAVSRTTYSALFAVIGTLYGAGDGSTTFNLPNVPTGYTDIVGTPGNAVSVGQMPAHSHYMGCAGSGTSATGSGAGAFSGQAGNTTTASSGSGTVNLAAGLPQLAIIKY